MLAQRLDHAQLRQWALHELGGYPDRRAVPAYRKCATEVLGDFLGPFGSGYRNLPIPPLVLPDRVSEEVREDAFSMVFDEGVGHLEDLVRKGGGRLQAAWSADFVAVIADQIIEGYHLARAWRVISPSFIQGMLDTIRTRVLSFALEIERENPAAGEADPGTHPIPAETVTNIVNMTIMEGSTSSVAIGSPGARVIGSFEVTVGDRGSLLQALSAAGVKPEDIAELEGALDEDDTAGDGNGMGKSVQRWLGKLSGGAVSQAVAGVATQIVLKYFGLAG